MSLFEDYFQLKACLKRDQACGGIGSSHFIFRAIWNPCYSVLYTFRWGTFLRKYKVFLPFYAIIFLWHRWNSYKTGIQMAFGTQIKPGLTFAHFGAIVINPKVEIGNNVLIYQDVTVGSQRGGGKAGAPKIGNNVIISSGAKVIGNVTIGNNVMIGANAVVVKDIPDNAIAVGVPAKVINFEAQDIIKDYLKL